MQGPPSTPRVTREYLLSHGFRQSATAPHVFDLENVRLADIAHKLGFSLAALRTTPNQPLDSDVRTVRIKDLVFVVRSQVRDENGRIVGGSLDNPDAICTVSVSLKQVSARKYLATDSSPSLSIKSATAPEGDWKPLHISFELAADGNTPLAVSQLQFSVHLSGAGQPSDLYSRGLSFPEETPQVITVLPGKPIVLNVSAFTNKDAGGPPNGLPSGRYVLSVVLGGRKTRNFDYQWISRPVHSEKCQLVVE